MQLPMMVKWAGIRITKGALAGFFLAFILSFLSFVTGGVGDGARAFLPDCSPPQFLRSLFSIPGYFWAVFRFSSSDPPQPTSYAGG